MIFVVGFIVLVVVTLAVVAAKRHRGASSQMQLTSKLVPVKPKPPLEIRSQRDGSLNRVEAMNARFAARLQGAGVDSLKTSLNRHRH
ncbi:MAG: hypothetical protein AAF219_02420 [Myxococcota bacterium]